MNIEAPHLQHIPALRNLWHEAFGDREEFLNSFFMTAFNMERCRCMIMDGNVVAALYWFDCQYMGRPIAYLYAVSTAKADRGRGLFHNLTEDTHLHLKTLGYEGVILVPANKKLFKLYESMGYQTSSYIREFSCTGTPEKVQLYSIDKTKYAALRRQMLPKCSVIQENENLDFLQTQAQLYAGPGFLLAVREESNTLYGIELLGDVTVAPKIVQTLGYTKGTFRTPGEETPFAMYHPLGENNLLPPGYFGLAFD